MADTIEIRISNAVAKLRDANQAYFELEYDEDSPQELGLPASDAEIQALEGAVQHALPPSYKAFLRQHNGWRSVSGGAMLLPTSEHSRPWVAKRIASIRDHFREFFPNVSLDDAFFVMLGQDEKDFAYLDLSSRGDGGELEVVYADLEEGEVDRYPDFAAYLEKTAQIAQELVDEA
jgi:SMI1/KNR4 family protein SUKH-1